jgi:hypothetical protein
MVHGSRLIFESEVGEMLIDCCLRKTFVNLVRYYPLAVLVRLQVQVVLVETVD